MSYSFHNSGISCQPFSDINNLSIEESAQTLAHKSSNLYQFWENYHRLYNQYLNQIEQNKKLQERVTQLVKMNEQICQKENDKVMKLVQENHELIGKVKQLKMQIDHKEQSILIVKEEKNGLQKFIHQLKEQNEKQQESINKIAYKIKKTNEITSEQNQKIEKYSYEVRCLNLREKKLKQCIHEKDEEIESLEAINKKMKKKYEEIIQEYLKQAKEKVEENIRYALDHSVIS